MTYNGLSKKSLDVCSLSAKPSSYAFMAYIWNFIRTVMQQTAEIR